MVPASESVGFPLGPALSLLGCIGISTGLTSTLVVSVAVLRPVLPSHVRQYT